MCVVCVVQAKARSSFFKQTKSYPMFLCREDKTSWDEYGEAIRCVPFSSARYFQKLTVRHFKNRGNSFLSLSLLSLSLSLYPSPDMRTTSQKTCLLHRR